MSESEKKPIVVLGPGRGEGLGLTQEAVRKRMDKLDEKLFEPVVKLVSAVAEGHAMSRGLTFDSGGEFAYILANYVLFTIAGLQEQGHLQKTLPRAGKKAPVDVKGTAHGVYL